MRRSIEAGLFCLFLTIFSGPISLMEGQIVPAAIMTAADGNNTLQRPSVVSEAFMFRHFFTHLDALERQAERADASGGSGLVYRNYYKNLLGFSPQQYAILTSSAAQEKAKLDVIDQRAQRIISAFREQIKNAPPSGLLPQPPKELAILQRERDSTTMAAVSNIRESLGAASFQRLKSMIDGQFGKHVTVQKIVLPKNPDAPTHARLEDAPILSGAAN
ncbi:MAG TPA: hypothetical protein VN633_23980 [Bryobacteraceae bacterium]|nr:hypothetical protein [Bryobacteraceae bacterium]